MKIIIVTALFCEASPIIKYYGLKKTLDFPFLVYGSENIECVISGIGKMNTAAAVGFMGRSASLIAWLNVGIAGHRNLHVGEGSMVHKIVDQATRKSIFPTMHPQFPQQRNTLFTVDLPEHLYPEEGLYDMEGYGFGQAALRFSPAEFVQSYKVISDNSTTEQKKIYPDWVRSLIETKITEIDTIVSSLHEMAHLIAPSPHMLPV